MLGTFSSHRRGPCPAAWAAAGGSRGRSSHLASARLGRCSAGEDWRAGWWPSPAFAQPPSGPALHPGPRVALPWRSLAEALLRRHLPLPEASLTTLSNSCCLLPCVARANKLLVSQLMSLSSSASRSAAEWWLETALGCTGACLCCFWASANLWCWSFPIFYFFIFIFFLWFLFLSREGSFFACSFILFYFIFFPSFTLELLAVTILLIILLPGFLFLLPCIVLAEIVSRSLVGFPHNCESK